MRIRCLFNELVPISVLKGKFHPKNRNNHPPEQLQRLAEILKYQGIRYPAKISNQTDFITSGHGRILAAELNGWTEFPVNSQDYDDEVQEYADVQADNAIASWSELDLSGVNMDIGELGPFDIHMLGIKNFVVEPADKLSVDDEWVDMPEFTQEDKMAHRTLKIHFAGDEAIASFANLLKQSITDKTKYLWYPEAVKEKVADKRYVSDYS